MAAVMIINIASAVAIIQVLPVVIPVLLGLRIDWSESDPLTAKILARA
jgi:hypothetical protein